MTRIRLDFTIACFFDDWQFAIGFVIANSVIRVQAAMSMGFKAEATCAVGV